LVLGVDATRLRGFGQGCGRDIDRDLRIAAHFGKAQNVSTGEQVGM
jgi:hypothetical protein